MSKRPARMPDRRTRWCAKGWPKLIQGKSQDMGDQRAFAHSTSVADRAKDPGVGRSRWRQNKMFLVRLPPAT